MRENSSGGLARDHGAHDVANCEGGRAFELGFALSGQGIRSFAGLADANGERSGVEDGIAIAEFAAVVDFDLHASEALDHEFSGESGVPTGSAGHDAHLLEIAKLLFGDLHVIEEDFSG